mmetsp:Transcript_8588/g.16887  ORF Transcript_8588/g.16887 Transcript_8588/m.16887 type:complete len:137 (-) Transcript_8588:59-469(-)
MAPKAEDFKKHAVKVSQKKKRRTKRKETYASYVYNMLKQIHPGLRISKKSMSIMESLLHDLFDKISSEAGNLCKQNKRKTLSARDIDTAVRLLFPRGEIGRNANSEGTRSLVRYRRTPSTTLLEMQQLCMSLHRNC